VEKEHLGECQRHREKRQPSSLGAKEKKEEEAKTLLLSFPAVRQIKKKKKGFFPLPKSFRRGLRKGKKRTIFNP